jgi:hypothetical protein
MAGRKAFGITYAVRDALGRLCLGFVMTCAKSERDAEARCRIMEQRGFVLSAWVDVVLVV